MGRKWIRTIKIGVDEFPPGWLHGQMDVDCETLTETDDGCPACQEELEAVEEHVCKQLDEQDLEVWDIMHVNRPGLQPTDDPYWEFDVEVSRK